LPQSKSPLKGPLGVESVFSEQTKGLGRAGRVRGYRRPRVSGLHLLNILKIGSVRMSKCRYCNSTSFGHCSTSPSKKHEHIEDEKKCEFCGSSSYGHCSTSPFGKHRHGHGGNKCIWCGSTSTGHCSTSPNGVHEK
jgi:hypothetical protein